MLLCDHQQLNLSVPGFLMYKRRKKSSMYLTKVIGGAQWDSGAFRAACGAWYSISSCRFLSILFLKSLDRMLTHSTHSVT